MNVPALEANPFGAFVSLRPDLQALLMNAAVDVYSASALTRASVWGRDCHLPQVTARLPATLLRHANAGCLHPVLHTVRYSSRCFPHTSTTSPISRASHPLLKQSATTNLSPTELYSVFNLEPQGLGFAYAGAAQLVPLQRPRDGRQDRRSCSLCATPPFDAGRATCKAFSWDSWWSPGGW